MKISKERLFERTKKIRKIWKNGFWKKIFNFERTVFERKFSISKERYSIKRPRPANALSFIKNAFQKTFNFRTKFKTISAFYDVTGMMLVKLFPKTNYYGESHLVKLQLPDLKNNNFKQGWKLFYMLGLDMLCNLLKIC